MSLISTFSAFSDNGWSALTPNVFVLKALSGNVANHQIQECRFAYDGNKIVGLDGTSNGNIVYYDVNSNNTISVSNTVAGNAQVSGASSLSYSKDTQNVVCYGAPTSDVGGTNRGLFRIYDNAVIALQVTGTANSQRLGSNTAINDNGNIVAISDNPIGSNASCFVYELSGGSWSLRDTITPIPRSVTMSSYMNDAGNILIFADQLANSIAVYEYSSNTWTNTANLTPANTTNLTSSFGQLAIINGSGNTIVFTDPGVYNNANSQGKTFVFKNSGNGWTQYQEIPAPILYANVTNTSPTRSIGLSQDGSIFGINYDNGNNIFSIGLYQDNGNNFELLQFLQSPVANTSIVPFDIIGNGKALTGYIDELYTPGEARLTVYINTI